MTAAGKHGRWAESNPMLVIHPADRDRGVAVPTEVASVAYAHPDESEILALMHRLMGSLNDREFLGKPRGHVRMDGFVWDAAESMVRGDSVVLVMFTATTRPWDSLFPDGTPQEYGDFSAFDPGRN